MFRKRIQLGLIHVAVAMTLVPINSTLNRVMIKELAISAALVALLASLPYHFSPIQVAIGSFSDRHPVWGFRRSPYILAGLLLCVLGVVVSPMAAFQLSENFWFGISLALFAFGAWGMGFNFASVSYLSLASELSGEKGRGRTIAIMFFVMITGIILTAIALSQLVDPYTPQALVNAFWIIGLSALLIGLVGLIKLESRSLDFSIDSTFRHSWRKLMQLVLGNRQVTIFFWYLVILLAAILGQDILLEPYGAEAFGLTVKETTRITSLWGVCVLAALVVAGLIEGRTTKKTIARIGAWGAFTGFVLIPLGGILINQIVFYSGVILLGIGTGLATVSNLSLMLDMTISGKVGLFIGIWGMANALSRLIGTILGGVVRDSVTLIAGNLLAGYIVVFAIEALLILVSLIMLRNIKVGVFKQENEQISLVEKAALAGDG